jgi:prepilin-type processing-associated H-X9-DG protein
MKVRSDVRRTTSRRGAALIDFLAAAAVVAAGLAILLPAVEQTQQHAQLTQCTENTKNLGKAFLEYEQTHGGLAPRRTGFGDGVSPYGGWGSRILPFLDKESNKEYHHDYDFFDPINKKIVETPIKTFLCPAAPEGRFTLIQANATANSANPNKDTLFSSKCGPVDFIASNGLFMPAAGYGLNWPEGLGGNQHQALLDNDNQPLSKITDGTSCTYLIVEKAGSPQVWRVGKRVDKPDLFAGANNSRGAWAGWGSLAYGTYDPKTGEERGVGDDADCAVNVNNTFGIYSFHEEGANALMCDGSVHFVGKKLNGLTHARLTTRDDGQIIAPDSF